MITIGDLLTCIKETNCVNKSVRQGKDVLRVRFPRGSAAPHGAVKGGFVAYHQCAGFPAKSAKISYSIYFDEKFEWNKGGKLPWGFYIGATGATGGRHTTEGGSVRLMWRRGGSAEAYLYFPNGTRQPSSLYDEPGVVKDNEFGMSLWRKSFLFKKGQFNNVSISLKLNDVGKQNGSLAVTINGTTKHFSGFMWRTDDKMLISGLVGAAFFGGNDSTWASPVDTFIDVTGVDLSAPTA